MKIFSWNCRGPIGATTMRSLLDFQRHFETDVIFLSETHLDEVKSDEVLWRLKFDHKLVAPSLDGTSGGLLLVWKKEVRIYSRTTTLEFIDVSIEEPDGRMWRMTGIYGEPSWDYKERTYWEGSACPIKSAVDGYRGL